MFTIVKKLIYIDNKNPNKMKKIKLIKWVGAGRYMSNATNTSIFSIEHVSPC